MDKLAGRNLSAPRDDVTSGYGGRLKGYLSCDTPASPLFHRLPLARLRARELGIAYFISRTYLRDKNPSRIAVEDG